MALDEIPQTYSKCAAAHPHTFSEQHIIMLPQLPSIMAEYSSSLMIVCFLLYQISNSDEGEMAQGDIFVEVVNLPTLKNWAHLASVTT